MFGDYHGIFKVEVFVLFWSTTQLMPLQQAYWLPGLSLYITPLHSLYFCLNIQAIIVIAKQSFWINKPFLLSVTEALDQYKQEVYVQKLKTDITHDSLYSGHQDFITFLHWQVTHIDGMYFVCAGRRKQWYVYLAGWPKFVSDILFCMANQAP